MALYKAVSDRLAGWQCLQRKFIDATPSGLSLRGGRRPTWQSRSTRPDHRKAIGENATAFPRLPRRFAPRNDTSGSAAVHQRPPAVEWLCTRRSVTALQAGNACSANSLTQHPQVCHCEEAAGRRGNLAVPDQITGKPSAKTQLPSRDCHVASLLAMTRQVVPWCISALLRLNCLVQGAH